MTLALTEPVNRTILLLDIEDFSRRGDVVQACLRRELHNVVEDTLAEAGVERNMQYREDRGDGLIVLVSADIPKTVLLRALLTTTPDALCQYNRLASSSAQMRLRMVLAAGEVAFDPKQGTVGGLVGHDLNQSCRAARCRRPARRARTAGRGLCAGGVVPRLRRSGPPRTPRTAPGGVPPRRGVREEGPARPVAARSAPARHHRPCPGTRARRARRWGYAQ